MFLGKVRKNILIFMVLVLSLLCVSSAYSAGTVLLEPAVGTKRYIQGERYPGIDYSYSTLKDMVVRANITNIKNVKPGDMVELFLGGEKILAETRYVEVEEHPTTRVTWVGRLAASSEKEFYTLILTIVENSLSGWIDVGTQRWEIIPTGDYLEGIVRDASYDISPPEVEDETERVTSEVTPLSDAPSDDATTEFLSQKDIPTSGIKNHTLDLFVIYSTDLKNYLGSEANVKSQVQSRVDYINVVLRNNKINGVVRVIGYHEIDIPNGRLPDGPSDLWERFAVITKEAKADMTALFLRFYYEPPSDSYCGLSSMTKFSEFSTSNLNNVLSHPRVLIVRIGSDKGYSCSNDVLSHELGHQLGMAHNKEAILGIASGEFPYAFGYCGQNYGTIMAYCWPRVPYYSENITIKDSVTGVERVIGSFEARNADVAKWTFPFYAGIAERNYRLAPDRVVGPITTVVGIGDYHKQGRKELLIVEPSTGNTGVWTLTKGKKTK